VFGNKLFTECSLSRVQDTHSRNRHGSCNSRQSMTIRPRKELIAHRIQNPVAAKQALGSDVDRFFRHYAIGIQEVLTAPGSPWQNAYVERVIGSVRRECVDHVIVLTGAGLRRVLHEYVAYYSRTRTHLGLNKDAPVSRPVAPPTAGRVIAIPQVGGLHHGYERAA
jgi:transposase InsO family protein